MKLIVKSPMNFNINLVILLSLLLSACNLPFGSTAVPTEEVPLATLELPLAPTETPVPLIPENPTIGSTLTWFDTSTLVFVPGGEFTMGADEPEIKDFNPAHPVELGGFWIYSTKVTREMYNLCASLGQCTPVAANSNEPRSTLSGTSLISFFTGPEGSEYTLKDLPVTDVTWEQADNYCTWAGGRLPTEAEWEKTARGEKSKIQPWGDETPACNLLNFGECGVFLSSVLDYPEGISDYKALDMAGNAYEWVNDWYQKDYYAQAPASNPPGPADGTKRSVRGSSFDTKGESVLSYLRSSLEPDQSKIDVGFRCVIEDPTVFAPICEAPVVIPIETNVPEPGQSSSNGGDSSAEYFSFDLSTISVKNSSFCANKSAKLGGGTFLVDDYSNLDWFYNSNCNLKDTYAFIYAIDPNIKWAGTGPGSGFINQAPFWGHGFYGPEGAKYTFTIDFPACDVKLSPPPTLNSVSAVCVKGYTLQSNGTCQYAGSVNQPASMSCPGGYSYNSETQCCTQNPPQAGSQPNQYPACGPGSIFDPQQKVCYKPGSNTSKFIPTSITYQFKLGTCDEPKPKDTDKPPSQPQPTPTFCDPATGACP